MERSPDDRSFFVPQTRRWCDRGRTFNLLGISIFSCPVRHLAKAVKVGGERHSVWSIVLVSQQRESRTEVRCGLSDLDGDSSRLDCACLYWARGIRGVQSIETDARASATPICRYGCIFQRGTGSHIRTIRTSCLRFLAMEMETFWDQVPVGVKRDLMSSGYERSYGPGKTIFCRGDRVNDVAIIRTGWARVTINPEPGVSSVVRLVAAGDLCGGQEAVINSPYRFDLISAADGIIVLMIPAHTFIGLCRSHPQILAAAFKVVSNHLRQSDELRAANDVRTRVALTFMMLCMQFGEAINDVLVEIDLPNLNRETFASLAATSCRSLDRSISFLYAQGILLESRNRYVVNRQALELFVGY